MKNLQNQVSHEYITHNIEEFNQVVDELFKKLSASDVVLLEGELGTGKTTLVKRIAYNLKINKIITSPTYAILKTYDKKLCHIDAYRINNEDLELDYYIDNNYYIFIEWSENISEYLENVKYQVNISYFKDSTMRKITIKEF